MAGKTNRAARGATLLSFEDYCEAIAAQTDLLARHVEGADPTAPVLTCPGWDLGRLLRHVGGDHRWAEDLVRTRATEPIDDGMVNDPSAYAHLDDSVLGDWLVEGAARLAEPCGRPDPTCRCGRPPTSSSSSSPRGSGPGA